MKGTHQQRRATPGRTTAGPALSQHARVGILVLVGLVVCLAGCQLPGIGTTPTPTATATEWQALHRQLHLPTVAPGTPCPVEMEKLVSQEFGLALGDGPVYPAAPWVHGTYSIDGAGIKQGWYELKVAWVSRPEYTGPTLIRGHQIDGTNALRFGGINGQELQSELDLPAGSRRSDGWGVWPTFTMPHVSGCYAYQVDGLSFSKVIVFQVVP